MSGWLALVCIKPEWNDKLAESYLVLCHLVSVEHVDGPLLRDVGTPFLPALGRTESASLALSVPFHAIDTCSVIN